MSAAAAARDPRRGRPVRARRRTRTFSEPTGDVSDATFSDARFENAPRTDAPGAAAPADPPSAPSAPPIRRPENQTAALARLNLAAPAVMRAGLAKALQAGPVAFIDVGASKVAWLIGRLERDGRDAPPRIRALAAGQAPSLGVGYGGLVDLSAAASAVRAARDAAETALAGGKALAKKDERGPTLTLHKTIGKKTIWSRAAAATLPGARPRSAWTGAEIELSGGAVAAEDASRAIAACPPPREEDGRLALHAEPIGWRVDDEASPTNPVGLRGRTLEVELHVLSGAEAAARNLDACFAAAETTLVSVAAGAQASGFGALTEDERREGAAVVDFGAAEATIGIFAGGRLVFGDALRLGANRATEDLMRAFDLSWEEAERLKRYDGALCDEPTAEAWGDGTRPADQSAAAAPDPRRETVRRLLRARWEETCELVRDRLTEGGFRRLPTRRVILAGGAAETVGLRALAARVIGASARVARPEPPKGSPAHFGGPAYAALAGLAAATLFDLDAGRAAPAPPYAASLTRPPAKTAAGRLARWVRQTW